MTLDHLRTAHVAVVGLTTTTASPASIVEAVVIRMDGATPTGGPACYYAAADPAAVPEYLRPNMRYAPSWSEVASHVISTIGGRTVVMHTPERFSLLRKHLNDRDPNWEPSVALFTEPLARQVWPDLTDYSLDNLCRATGQHSSAQRGLVIAAGVEAQLVAATVTALVAGHSLVQPAQPFPHVNGHRAASWN